MFEFFAQVGTFLLRGCRDFTACETAACTGFVLVTGEITTKANLDIPAIVRKTVNEIGYDSSEKGFDGNTCAVFTALDKQSPDIAMGVDKALEAKENKMTDAEIVPSHKPHGSSGPAPCRRLKLRLKLHRRFYLDALLSQIQM